MHIDPFNQDSFNQFVIKNNVIGFFNKPITLKSGRKSNWYVNWRTVTNDVFLIDQLTDFIISFTMDNKITPDCFYGVPEGAAKLGIITQYKWAKLSQKYQLGSHILAMGRSKPKEHGAPQDKFFIGEPQGKVVLLEDVTTTGMSMLKTLDKLIELGINVIACIGLTNRMELRDDNKSVYEAVLERKVPYFEMSKATELLPLIGKI